MPDKTDIEWTDATWNPIRGCSRVSEGCRNCYAEAQAARIISTDRSRGVPEGAGAYDGLLNAAGRWNGQVRVVESLLEQPLRWRKPRRIFVNSMSDLFHESVPDEVIARIFHVMARATHHTFQVLTKRPKRMRDFLANVGCWEGWWTHDGTAPADAYRGTGHIMSSHRWPLPNLWLGVSIENQDTADERIPLLLDTPAAVRWVSAEPLLNGIALQGLDRNESMEYDEYRQFLCKEGPKDYPHRDKANCIDWVVVGGESGPVSRPLHPEWIRSLRDQCTETQTPFLFKQWGEWVPETQNAAALTEKAARSALYVDLDGSTRSAAVGSRKLASTVQKVGKRAAGRKLDNVIHDGYPKATSELGQTSQPIEHNACANRN